MDEATGAQLAWDFARIADELGQDTESLTLDRIVELAVDSIDACAYCGISLREAGGQIATPASTGPLVVELDELQYKLEQGPCLDAAWSLGTYLIEDTATESRWPLWCPEAAQRGIRSVLSLQLETPTGSTLGGLNLYAIEPDAFDNTDLAVASIFVRHAGSALTRARSQNGMRAAIRSRQTIGVAQGILMQRFGLTLDQSFEVLRRHSQDRNIKLRTLAENLVLSGGLPPAGEDSTTTAEVQLQESFGLTDPSADQ